VPEHGVAVTAKLISGKTQSGQIVVDLEPGQRRAVDLGGFSLDARTLYLLTVAVGPISGDATPENDQQSMALSVAG
jgi:hypothetical protein